MDADRLSEEERTILLEQARHALTCAVTGNPMNPLDISVFSEKLRQPGVTFVTLTINHDLRGCVGALEPYQSLVEDVREHASAAALKDYRFPPVSPDELGNICIEVSRLTTPKPLDYDDPDDLLKKLRPGVDGVVLRDELRRATFLPQVWDKITSPATFLEHLCQKMGAPPDLWRHKRLEVLVYQVEKFTE